MWEFKFFRYVDIHPDVIWWQSEEVVVPYYSPIDGKRHRYYPDVIVHSRVPLNKGGGVKTLMIEIKPKYQTRPPDINKRSTPKGRVSRAYLNEVKTWGINEAKWKYANEWCLDNNMEFKILTEDHLNIRYK
jgi:hypothetical protein